MARASSKIGGVLDKYSEWLLGRREDGWHVIDLHGQMARALAERREQDPNFTFQRDAVHPGAEGHEVIAKAVIGWFGEDDQQQVSPQAAKLIQQRNQLLRDAYLSAAKHKRPGVRPGLPLDDAN